MSKRIINLNYVIESVKDLKWANEQKTVIDCIVKFDVHDEELPFSINQNDFYQHSIELWENANAGKYGEIAEYTPPPEPEETEFEQLMDNYKNQFDGNFSLDKI